MQLINHFTNHLKADNLETNHVRLVKNACFSFVNPTPTKKPKMIHLNEDFLRSFDMEKEDYHSHNTERLNVEGVKTLISKLAYVRKELFGEEVEDYLV